MSRKHVLQFTTTLSELMDAELNLRSALDVMNEMTGINKKCRQAAYEIKNSLSEGSRFSMALKRCQSLCFDDVYIAFVCASEKNGQLRKTISFLKEREKGRNEFKEKIISICMYPAMVILMALAGGILLAFYSTKLVADFSGNFDFLVYKKNVFAGCVQANLFLLTAGFGFCFLLKKVLDKNVLLDIFRVLDFMTESNVGFYASLETALLIAGKNERIKNRIGEMMSDISSGKKVSDALENLGMEFKLFAEIAEMSGNLEKVFKQICSTVDAKVKRIEKICMDLINPAIMIVVGIYIIILIKKIAMPVLFNFGI